MLERGTLSFWMPKSACSSAAPVLLSDVGHEQHALY